MLEANNNYNKENSFMVVSTLLIIWSLLNGVCLMLFEGVSANVLGSLSLVNYLIFFILAIMMRRNFKLKYMTICLGINTFLHVINNWLLLAWYLSFGYLSFYIEHFLSFLLMFLVMLILTVFSINLWKKENVVIFEKIWFVPGILSIIGTLILLFDKDYLFYIYGLGSKIIACLLNVLFTVIVFLFGKKLTCFHETKVKDNKLKENVYESVGYIDIFVHVLLLLLTFGIWNFVWVYKTTEYLNRTPNEEYRNPTNKLLLCIFVPFYQIYWVYQTARRIDILARSKNIESDITTLSLVLAIFVGIVPPILMQSKINEICTTKVDVDVSYSNNNLNNNADFIKQDVKLGTADEIKKYKELLDMGAITVEEYEAKKKKLLDL